MDGRGLLASLMDAILRAAQLAGYAAGRELAIGSGAMMASLDAFEITLTGKSCHMRRCRAGRTR